MSNESDKSPDEPPPDSPAPAVTPEINPKSRICADEEIRPDGNAVGTAPITSP